MTENLKNSCKNFSGVRLASIEDIDSIFDFLIELHYENGMFKMNSKKVMLQLQTMLDPVKGNPGIIGVIDGQNGLEASIGMTIDKWWYTDENSLNEKWNFVHPKHRKTTHAKRLIEFAKWCSEVTGNPLLMGIISTEKTEAKIRLYRRQLDFVGGFFSYGLSSRAGKPI